MSKRIKNKLTKTTEKKKRSANCILSIIFIHQKISLGLIEQSHFTTANARNPTEDI